MVTNHWRVFLMGVIFLLMIFIFFLFFAPVSFDTIKENHVRGGDIMQILSPVFTHLGTIPQRYTCQGEDSNPPLVIQNIPQEAKSLVLYVHDPDAPGKDWIHWVVWNIPVTGNTMTIPENSVPGKQAYNDFGKHAYGGPCPPFGKHRYYFEVYALRQMLNLSDDATWQDIAQAMQPLLLEKAVLIGMYEKH